MLAHHQRRPVLCATRNDVADVGGHRRRTFGDALLGHDRVALTRCHVPEGGEEDQEARGQRRQDQQQHLRHEREQAEQRAARDDDEVLTDEQDRCIRVPDDLHLLRQACYPGRVACGAGLGRLP